MRVGTRTLREESEQYIFLCNIGLLGRACINTFNYKFYNIKPFFLILILGQGPFLLFDSLSYNLLIWAKVELYKPTILRVRLDTTYFAEN